MTAVDRKALSWLLVYLAQHCSDSAQCCQPVVLVDEGWGWRVISSGPKVTQISPHAGKVPFATMDRAKQTWLPLCS